MSKLFVNTIQPNSGDTVTISGSLLTTGKLTIGDASTDTVDITAEITSSLIPDITATFDLGTMSKAWRNLHAHGVGHIHTASLNVVSSSLLPDTGATYALGTMAKSWGSAHIHGLAHIHTASIGQVTSSLTPSVGGVLDLGTMDKAWRNLHAHGLGHIHTASINLVSSSLTPDADNTYDLGSSGKQWKDLHVKNNVSCSIIHVNNISISGSTIRSNEAGQDLNITPRGGQKIVLDSTINIDGGNLTGVDNFEVTSITASNSFSMGSGVGISASIGANGIISAVGLTLDKNIESAAKTDATHYSINGKRVEVRSQLQSSVAVDTGWTLELRNTSIAANSLIIANVIEGSAGSIITGSVVTANVISANSASLNFFNTGIATIPDDSPFTASIAIL